MFFRIMYIIWKVVKKVLHTNKTQIHCLNPNSLLPVVDPFSLRLKVYGENEHAKVCIPEKVTFKLFQSEYSFTNIKV